MNLCLYQGTFNPIHYAHLRVAEYVIKENIAEKILFIPAFIPPHKTSEPDMSEHRFKMLQLAIKPYPEFEISDIEYKRGGISYTYITICELYEIYKIEDKIKFIIGTDAFKNIESGYETEKLKELVEFIVFVRESNFNPNDIEYLKEKGYKFILANLEFSDISSTELRKKIKSGKSVKDLIPEEVGEYIRDYGLYK